MSRSEMRELIRRAQAAELEGDPAKAVQMLELAAAEAIKESDPARAASLLRHCLRLEPGREDLSARLDQLGLELPSGPPREVSLRRPHLELPQRGPTPADPSVSSWCSFCCRPKDEVGPMVAGPAGAFICAPCLAEAARIAEVDLPARDAAPAGPPPARAGKSAEFIDAAVILSRELRWTLEEVRSLSPEERQRALDLLRSRGGAAGG